MHFCIRSSVLVHIVFLLLFLGMLPSASRADDAQRSANSLTLEQPLAGHSLYVKVQLEGKLKLSALNPGDVVEGTLLRSVYSGDTEVFPAGSTVRLTVDTLGKRRRTPNDHWPWVIKAFTPRHEKYPVFRSAQVLMADGTQTPLRVSLISISREFEVHAQAKGKPSSNTSGPGVVPPSSPQPVAASTTTKVRSTAPTAIFEATMLTGAGVVVDPKGKSSPRNANGNTVAAGTQAKAILLGGVSASRSRPGDSFHARLVEPVRLGQAVVLPEGSVFDGKVVKTVRPRMLSRAGSLLLTFTKVSLPDGTSLPVAASLAGLQLQRGSHTRVDSEGQLKGERPGKAWMLINVGTTAGIAKEVDDATQLLVEAVVSTATDASTAGTARIASTCISGIFMLTRHGRDVVLPEFTEMNIAFDRPVALPTKQPVPIAMQDNWEASKTK